jgi:hypothetical protein
VTLDSRRVWHRRGSALRQFAVVLIQILTLVEYPIGTQVPEYPPGLPRRRSISGLCSCYLQELQNVRDGVVWFMGICDHKCIVNKINLYYYIIKICIETGSSRVVVSSRVMYLCRPLNYERSDINT